jgi:two-component system, OmpR family, response regulator
MRWIRISCLAIIAAVLVCMTGAAAEEIAVPDYGKIVQIHLKYQDSGYSVSSLEVRYGQAPNQNIQTGPLKGAILGSDGKVLKSFSLSQPGIGYGDILGSSEDSPLIGYSEIPPATDMYITVPYLADMKTFTLTNAQDGSLLVSADLSAPVAAFCTDYGSDPDCLALSAPAPSAAPDSGLYVVLAAVLSVSVILAAGLVYMATRRRPEASTPEKRTVLVVDDEPDIVHLIHLFLDRKGYATLGAASGKECLAIIGKQIPDLILLDVGMAPMDGWQTLGQIKKDPDTKSIPVLMLTGKRLTAAEAKQYKLCIDDYIEKPFQQAELYAAIDSILERKQKLKDTLVLAKKAGIKQETFCEFARLTRRISVDKKIVDILQVPQAVPMTVDMDTLDRMSVVDYLNVKTHDHEKRVEQLRLEINTSFRSKGLPELTW